MITKTVSLDNTQMTENHIADIINNKTPGNKNVGQLLDRGDSLEMLNLKQRPVSTFSLSKSRHKYRSNSKPNRKYVSTAKINSRNIFHDMPTQYPTDQILMQKLEEAGSDFKKEYKGIDLKTIAKMYNSTKSFSEFGV